jgi:CRP-like cAMP-binding protein
MNVHPLDWLILKLAWVDVPGYVGAVFFVISFLMKRIIPLRIMAIVSNVCFILYYELTKQYPPMFLYLVLLPLNAVRLYQMVMLTRRVRSASRGELSLGVLRPFMRRRHFKAGQIVFRKNEPADNLYYLTSGEFRVAEIGVLLKAGDYMGELGLLAPEKRRTQTVECVADGDVLLISYEHVSELYYQNPDFGYHLLRLTAGRLFQNIEVLQNQVQLLQAEVAALRNAPPAAQA